MSFVPLNLIEDASLSRKEKEAEHSRELQVEEAFKIFEQALSLQKSGDLAACYKRYESLFKLDVISNHYDEELMYIKGIQNGGASTVVDELNFLPPNVKSLRYLIFRNRAFLYLDLLRSGTPLGGFVGGLEQDALKQVFYTMMDDLVICLIYQEADEDLLEILFEITVFADCLKLARLILEYVINSKQESSDILGLIPVDPEVSELHASLRHKLACGPSAVFDAKAAQIQAKYAYLDSIKSDIKKSISGLRICRVVDINIASKHGYMTWASVVASINDKIKAEEDKSRTQMIPRSKIKDLDPYELASMTMSRVRLVIPETSDEMDEPDDKLDEEQPERTASPAVEQENDPEPINPEGEPSTNPTEVVPVSEEPNEEEDKTQPESAGTEEKSAPKNLHRSSKRLQKQDLDPVSYLPDLKVSPKMFVETTNFIKDLNEFFHSPKVTLPEVGVSDIVDKFVADGADTSYINDFKVLLNEYNPREYTSSMFLMDEFRLSKTAESGKSDSERLKLLEVLRLFGGRQNSMDNEQNQKVASLDDTELSDIVQQFVDNVNLENSHVNDIKVSILQHLLNYKDGIHNLLIDTEWKPSMYNDIRTWVIQLEQRFLINSRRMLEDADRETRLQETGFAVSVFEILSDYYITLKAKIDTVISQNVSRGITKSAKANLSVQTSEVLKIKDIVEKWKFYVDGLLHNLNMEDSKDPLILHMLLRFKWSVVHKEKIENANFQNSVFISNQLNELSQLIESAGSDDYHISMPNYGNITELSAENFAILASTVSVLTMFAKILFSKEGENNNEAIYLLEQTLIDDSAQGNTEEPVDPGKKPIVAIRNFLYNSSIDIRLSLWNILFSYYDKTNDFTRFQFGFERNVETLLNYLKSPNYLCLDFKTRACNLLKVFAFFDEYVIMYLDHLSHNNWILLETSNENKSSIHATFQHLIELFESLYLFSLHEESALITSQKNSLSSVSAKVYNKFKSMLVRITSIMVVYYGGLLRVSNPDVGLVNSQCQSFLSLLHTQFGFRGLCDSGDGIFLRIFQDSLLNTDWQNCERDLIQLIRCRYHCAISVKGITSYDHRTLKADDLDEKTTFKLASFILPICMSKDPLSNPPKGDLKTLVDQLYNVVGDPDYEVQGQLSKNHDFLTDFLDRSVISTSFVRDTFYGLIENSNDPVEDDKSKIVRDGLYLLQALLLFASYKVRRKSMQGRSVELDTIISLLKNDLVYCPDRVESWYSLGLAYGFLVEDDLIWTSDKLTIIERKITTANLQRRSLICYLMAINYMNTVKDSYVHSKPLVSGLTAAFANEMYAACAVPMDMLAFKVKESPRFIRKETGASFVPMESNPMIKKELCFKVIQQSLHLAIKADSSEWSNYYLLSKVQSKLHKDPKDIVETLLEAGVYAAEQSIPSDVILEPHYRLCSVLYKYVKSDKLKVDQAFAYLKRDTLLKEHFEVPEDISDKSVFYEIIIECLRKFVQFDKKKWHHKYRYRMAKILLDEFNRTAQAREEMAFIVSLKPTSKSLVSIWKPENERPGKHFFYTFQYTLFFIQILCKELNLMGLIQMLPRLRRSNSIMISLTVAWETLCSAICKILRDLFEVNDQFTDSFLNTPYFLFVEHTKQLVASYKTDIIAEAVRPHLCFLASLNEMKKLNNGFGPTSLIDDTIVAIFIKVYYSFRSENSERASVESPYSKPKRLAKRDIFPVVNDMLSNAKRNIDAIIKETPDFLNKFATTTKESRGKPPAPVTSAEVVDLNVIEEGAENNNSEPANGGGEKNGNGPDASAAESTEFSAEVPKVTAVPAEEIVEIVDEAANGKRDGEPTENSQTKKPRTG